MAQRSGSLNVGPIGLDIELRLEGFHDTLDSLTSALTGPVDMLGDKVAEAVSKFRSADVQDLQKNWECCQRGDESCCHGESKDLFSKIVEQLKTAADKGAQSARSLLDELGQGVETTGQKMQDVAAPEGQEHHQQR